MNDLDQQLRSMFVRREEDVRHPVPVPPHLTRRVRVRQLRTTGLVGLSVAAIVGAGIVGFQALTDRTGTYVPAVTDDRSETAFASGLSITYPASWQLTIVQTEPDFDSVNILTNFQLDPEAQDPCARMPADGVALIVRTDVDIPRDATSPSWPVDLKPEAAPRRCTLNDLAMDLVWSTDVGRAYGAASFVGDQAPDADRDRLIEAFESMTFQGYDAQAGGTGIVIASGTIDDRAWMLTAAHGQSAGGPSLRVETSQEGGGLSGAGFGTLEVRAATDVALSAPTMHGNTLMHGGVTLDVARIRVTPDGAEPFDLPLYDLPNVLGFPLRVFVAPMGGAPTGTFTTYDASGQVLARVRFSPGTACWSGKPCPGAVTPRGPIAQGTIAHVDWRLDERDGELRLTDDAGAVIASVPSDPAPLRVVLVELGARQETADFVFGVASPDTTSVILFTSGLPGQTQTVTLSDGRLVFWAGSTPATGRGQILAFDSTCSLVGAVDLQTGDRPAEPALTDCAT